MSRWAARQQGYISRAVGGRGRKARRIGIRGVLNYPLAADAEDFFLKLVDADFELEALVEVRLHVSPDNVEIARVTAEDSRVLVESIP
jgi:hypothetical protein